MLRAGSPWSPKAASPTLVLTRAELDMEAGEPTCSLAVLHWHGPRVAVGLMPHSLWRAGPGLSTAFWWDQGPKAHLGGGL